MLVYCIHPHHSKTSRCRVCANRSRTRPAEDRFWHSVDPCRTDNCWLWLAAKVTHGYGSFFNGQFNIRAHTFLIGRAPAGLEWDHICRVHNCVNPDHLEAVTHLENVRRGIAGTVNGARLRNRTACIHGHLFSEAITHLTKQGWRVCRICQAVGQRNRRIARQQREVHT